MRSPADILRALPIVQDIIDRHDFEPAKVVKAVPASKYLEAIGHLQARQWNGRWYAKKDHKAQTYSFLFKDAEDAFIFQMCI